jgi:hypothetical protein
MYYVDSHLDTNLGTVCGEHEKHCYQEIFKYLRGRILSCHFFSIFFDFHLKRLPQVFSESQSHSATDGKSISKFWCLAPSGPHDEISINV